MQLKDVYIYIIIIIIIIITIEMFMPIRVYDNVTVYVETCEWDNVNMTTHNRFTITLYLNSSWQLKPLHTDSICIMYITNINNIGTLDTVIKLEPYHARNITYCDIASKWHKIMFLLISIESFIYNYIYII